MCGLTCVQACLFKMSNVVCKSVLHLGWALCKAQKLSMTISVAMKENLTKGRYILSPGQ